MGFEERQPAHAWPSADGRMPEGATPTSLGFAPLTCSAGDLVLIHGQAGEISGDIGEIKGRYRATWSSSMGRWTTLNPKP